MQNLGRASRYPDPVYCPTQGSPMGAPTASPPPSPAATQAGAAASLRAVNVWQAPLVPVALAVTAGIVADRYVSIPLLFSLILAIAGIVAWALSSRGPGTGLSLIYLGISAAGVGAAYHHWQRDVYALGDIGDYATSEE